MEVVAIIVIIVASSMLTPFVIVRFSKQQLDKLDTIHTLVNSNLTVQIQGNYDSTVRELAALREISRLHVEAGREPSPKSVAVIEETQKRLSTLFNLLEAKE